MANIAFVYFCPEGRTIIANLYHVQTYCIIKKKNKTLWHFLISESKKKDRMFLLSLDAGYYATCFLNIMQKCSNVKYEGPGHRKRLANPAIAPMTPRLCIQPWGSNPALSGSVSEGRPLWAKQCQSDRDICLKACGTARILSA